MEGRGIDTTRPIRDRRIVFYCILAGFAATPNERIRVALAPDGATLYAAWTRRELGTGLVGADVGLRAFDAATGATLWDLRYDEIGMEDRATGLVASSDGERR